MFFSKPENKEWKASPLFFLSFSLSQTCVKILLMSIIYSFVDHSRLTCPYDLMGGFLLEIKARKRERERERGTARACICLRYVLVYPCCTYLWYFKTLPIYWSRILNLKKLCVLTAFMLSWLNVCSFVLDTHLKVYIGVGIWECEWVKYVTISSGLWYDRIPMYVCCAMKPRGRGVDDVWPITTQFRPILSLEIEAFSTIPHQQTSTDLLNHYFRFLNKRRFLILTIASFDLKDILREI